MALWWGIDWERSKQKLISSVKALWKIHWSKDLCFEHSGRNEREREREREINSTFLAHAPTAKRKRFEKMIKVVFVPMHVPVFGQRRMCAYIRILAGVKWWKVIKLVIKLCNLIPPRHSMCFTGNSVLKNALEVAKRSVSKTHLRSL